VTAGYTGLRISGYQNAGRNADNQSVNTVSGETGGLDSRFNVHGPRNPATLSGS
jgi:hypothetical protein